MTPTTRLCHLVRSLERPGFSILVLLGLSIGLLQRPTLPSAVTQAALTLALLAWAIATAAVNDVADEAIDRVNLVDDPRRVLVRGLASRGELVGIALVATVVALVAAALAGGVWTVVVVLCGSALSLAYSLPPMRLSDRGAVSSVILPLGYVAVPFALGATAGGLVVTARGLVLLAGLGVGAIGRLALKDFRDVDGDRLFGKRTLLVRHGRARVCDVALGSLVAGTALVDVGLRGDVVAITVVSLLTVAMAVVLTVLRGSPGPIQELLVSDVALLARAQLLVVVCALSTLVHGWSPAFGAVACSSVAAGALVSATTCHTRLRYVPISPAPAIAPSPTRTAPVAAAA